MYQSDAFPGQLTIFVSWIKLIGFAIKEARPLLTVDDELPLRKALNSCILFLRQLRFLVACHIKDTLPFVDLLLLYHFSLIWSINIDIDTDYPFF